MSNKSSIAVCTDKNYGKFLPILLESIMLNTTKDIHFFVVYSSLNEEDKNNITKIVSQKEGCVVDFIFFNFKDEIAKFDNTPEFKPFRNGFDAYSRLFLPQLLAPFNVNSCLYLDVDIIVNNNIDELLEKLPEVNCIAGVKDTVSIDLKIPLAHENYVNSGVLLFNLETLRKKHFSEESLKYGEKNFEKLVLPDQDIISNVYPAEFIELIDCKWNMFYSKTKLVKSGHILHYTGPYKPWMTSCRWRLKKCIWVKYEFITKQILKGKQVSSQKIKRFENLLNASRIFLNLFLKIKIMLGIVK